MELYKILCGNLVILFLSNDFLIIIHCKLQIHVCQIEFDLLVDVNSPEQVA